MTSNYYSATIHNQNRADDINADFNMRHAMVGGN